MRGLLETVIGQYLLARSVWGVELANGTLYTERTMMHDCLIGKRPFDWSLDLVATGDIQQVRQLLLYCPPNLGNPEGQVVQLPLVEPRTGFQFKVAHMHSNIASSEVQVASQVIGRVIDKASGACECFIWDVDLKKLGMFTTTVYDFASWRPEIAHIGPLSLDVLGLRL